MQINEIKSDVLDVINWASAKATDGLWTQINHTMIKNDACEVTIRHSSGKTWRTTAREVSVAGNGFYLFRVGNDAPFKPTPAQAFGVATRVYGASYDAELFMLGARESTLLNELH